MPYLLLVMTVFPLFLHIVVHVLYFTCFPSMCLDSRLARVYSVSGYAPMSPGISYPVLLSHFVATATHLKPRFPFSFFHIPFIGRFLNCFLLCTSDNMFCEIPTLSHAARHDSTTLFSLLTSLYINLPHQLLNHSLNISPSWCVLICTFYIRL